MEFKGGFINSDELKMNDIGENGPTLYVPENCAVKNRIEDITTLAVIKFIKIQKEQYNV